MNVINLTPHAINVILANGETRTFQPSGQIARVAISQESAGDVGGIPISRSVVGEPQGLPDPVEGTIYIVSTPLAQKARRADVVSPDTSPTAIREKGQVVAVRGFQTF